MIYEDGIRVEKVLFKPGIPGTLYMIMMIWG